MFPEKKIFNFPRKKVMGFSNKKVENLRPRKYIFCSDFNDFFFGDLTGSPIKSERIFF